MGYWKTSQNQKALMYQYGRDIGMWVEKFSTVSGDTDWTHNLAMEKALPR